MWLFFTSKWGGGSTYTWQNTVHALYIISLFVRLENNSFEMKQTCYLCLHSLVKTSAKFIFYENSPPGENSQLHLMFSLTCSQILPNIHSGFYQIMKAWRKNFVS